MNSARYQWYRENVIGYHPVYTLMADNVGYHWTPTVQRCIDYDLHRLSESYRTYLGNYKCPMKLINMTTTIR